MGQRAYERVEEGLCSPDLRKYVGKYKVHEAGSERLKGYMDELSNFF